MDEMREELIKLKQEGSLRSIPDIYAKEDDKIIINDGLIPPKTYVNFASNDYLGISTENDLRREFLFQTDALLSSASARLLSGTSVEFKQLEETLAKLFDKESALVFNTGYQCNLGVLSALCTRGTVVFSDKLNHASIIDGMRLAEGDFCRYKHLDYDNLETLLKKKRNDYKRAIIVSESVFSMDGDCADIDKLIELKNKYDCILMLDEAHAFCAIGDTLAGLSYKKDVDVITATFGKALGSFGAFCVSNSEIIAYLINKARSFIFSTSIPPINIAWTNWLLNEKSEFINNQKRKLQRIIKESHDFLSENQINTVSRTHIIPILIGDNEKTLQVSEQLKSLGYYIPAIRPPTVPNGSSRLRISLTAKTDINDFRRVIKTACL